jgi:hypothetical protein
MDPMRTIQRKWPQNVIQRTICVAYVQIMIEKRQKFSVAFDFVTPL